MRAQICDAVVEQPRIAWSNPALDKEPVEVAGNCGGTRDVQGAYTSKLHEKQYPGYPGTRVGIPARTGYNRTSLFSNFAPPAKMKWMKMRRDFRLAHGYTCTWSKVKTKSRTQNVIFG
eukprot:3375141-Rhodomonas_salina.1